jgi:hypothetical protein
MAPSKPESIQTWSQRRSVLPVGVALRPGSATLLMLALLFCPTFASAQDEKKSPDPNKAGETSLGLDPTMSLDPSAPQAGALPGGMTPAFGQKSLNASEWRFDFHGFLTIPLNMGIAPRQVQPGQTTPAVREGQSSTALHAPPVVPDDLETFSHTGVIPTTYAQLNLSEGNGIVTANLSILARQTNVSETFLEPASQLGISDAFLSIVPDVGRRVRLQILVGAFTSRYGSTGEYDEGTYGTPLIARINGAGEQASARIGLGKYTVLLEQGIVGQTNKAGASVTPDVWNQFADPAQGATFVNHWHAGLAYRSLATLGAHFISAWSQDDHSTNPLAPDGSVTVVATDLRLTMARFGHLYLAFAHTGATHARSISRVLSVLNAPGGKGLMDNYLGREQDGGDGTGSLTTVGGQYNLSVGRLVSYPTPFTPDGPDVVVSLFGLMTRVGSHVSHAAAGPIPVYGDGVTKLKYGAEVSYGLLPWLAVSGRYDRVVPDVDSSPYTFAVLSPRVIFRTGWTSTDQLVLQYSHWFDGSLTTVRTGEPPLDTAYVFPDKDTLSLSASMWW